jgi:uncharacterized protein YegP (UPF0339 family)
LYKLEAAHGEIIAVSEAYNQKSSAENGIDSVRRNAQTAPIADLT